MMGVANKADKRLMLLCTMKHFSRIIIVSGIIGAMAPVAVFGAFHEVLKERVEDQKEKIRQERDELKQKIDERKDALKEKSRELKGELQERRDVIKRDLEVRRTAMKAEVKQMRDDFRAKTEARKDELKKKFGEKRAERIEQFFNRMVGKFEAAIDRLERSAERLEQRINAAVAAGRDMTKPMADLAAAQAKIDEAEKALTDAKAKYAELGTSQDAKKKFADVKALVQGVEQKVKDAHAALVRTIAGMKGMGTVTGTTTSAAPAQ